MQSYEVEVKALLGSLERADALRTALHAADPDCKRTSESKQLNHYFELATESTPVSHALLSLARTMTPHIDGGALTKLEDLSSRASSFSVRTREKDAIVILVVKASVGDDSSENGVTRMEFEVAVPLTLAELDNLVIQSGFRYQAKWSREREEYLCRGITVCLDKNAGYGYVAEFERVVEDQSALDAAREDIRALMRETGVEELPQDRLERMFAYYNANWPEYYGTDKIFHVE